MPVKNYLREAMTRQREKPKGPETPPKAESEAATLDTMKQKVDQAAADFSTEGANMGKEGEAGMDEAQKGRWARIKEAAATATTNVREFVAKLFSKKEDNDAEESAEPTTYDEYNASGPEIKTGALTAEDQQLTTDHEIEDISVPVEKSDEVQNEPIIDDLAELAIEEEGQRIIEAEQETNGPTQWGKPTTEQAEAMRPKPKIGKEAAKKEEKKEFNEDKFDPTNIEEFQQCIDFAINHRKEAGLVRIFRAYLLDHDGDIGIAIREQKRIAESGSAEWTGFLLIPIAVKIADTDPLGAIKFVRSSTDSSEILRRCFSDIAISRAKLGDMQTGITICQECFPQQQEEGSGYSYANSVRARMAENAPKPKDTTTPRAAPETIPNSIDLKAAIGRKKEVPPEITEAQEALDKAIEKLAEDGQTAEHIEKNPEIIRLKKELKDLRRAQEKKDKPKYIPPSSLENPEIIAKAEDLFNEDWEQILQIEKDIKNLERALHQEVDNLSEKNLSDEEILQDPKIIELNTRFEALKNISERYHQVQTEINNTNNRINAVANEINDIAKMPEGDAKKTELARATARHQKLLGERNSIVAEAYGPQVLDEIYKSRPMPKDVLAPRPESASDDQDSASEDTEPEFVEFDENADGSDESDEEPPVHPLAAGANAETQSTPNRERSQVATKNETQANPERARVDKIIQAIKPLHRETIAQIQNMGRPIELRRCASGSILIFDGPPERNNPVDFISQQALAQYNLIADANALSTTSKRAEDIPLKPNPTSAAA